MNQNLVRNSFIAIAIPSLIVLFLEELLISIRHIKLESTWFYCAVQKCTYHTIIYQLIKSNKDYEIIWLLIYDKYQLFQKDVVFNLNGKPN